MSNFGYALIMFLAGIGIPIMAALNGTLAVRLQNPALATAILLAVAFLLSLINLIATTGLSNPLAKATPFYFYLAGLFVIFYMLSLTWVAPKFGIGNAIAFVLLGQIASMVLVDHFQWLGAAHFPITFKRALGVILMTVGVFLAVKPNS